MSRETKIALQELLASKGWEEYLSLVNGLEKRLNNDLLSAGRSGDNIKSAQFAGQIDIVPVLIKLPENELKKMG